MRLALGLILATLLAVSAPADAEPLACDNGIVTASAAPDVAAQICAASDHAINVLENCGLTPPKAVEIRALPEIDADCIGVFHCGQGLIEILTPQAMQEKRRATSLFANLPPRRMFDSVIVHEMAHAAFDDTPCPFDDCVASSEFFAYALQIASLSDAELANLNGSVPPDDAVKRDSLTAIILYMAPDRFAASAWAYLNQRDDRCRFLRRVQAGDVVFDRFHP